MSSRILLTLALMAVIVILGFRMSREGRVADGEIGLEVNVPATYIAPRLDDGIPMLLPVRVRLVNRRETPETLTAPTACKIFRYIVLTGGGDFVQGAGQNRACAQEAQSASIDAGEAIEELFQLPLDAARFAAGDYKVWVRFWGYEATADFKVQLPAP